MYYVITDVIYSSYKNESVVTLKLKNAKVEVYRSFIFENSIYFNSGDEVDIIFTSNVIPRSFKIKLYKEYYDIRFKLFKNHREFYLDLYKNHTKIITL